jgi:hypothetical protein
MVWESFIGKAGQLATMAEFLLRGYNVAMPEVDVGDDVFVVNNRAEKLWRIQVKTATGEPRGYGCSAQFLLSLKQLREPAETPLFYVLTLRWDERWEFLVISQKTLRAEYKRHSLGAATDGNLVLYCAFKKTEVICSNRNLQNYRNNWNPWPRIVPG